MASLSSFGLFNPVPSLPAKFKCLEFVEMSDIMTYVELPQTSGHPTTSARIQVTDISICQHTRNVLPGEGSRAFCLSGLHSQGNRWVVYDIDREPWQGKTLNGLCQTPTYVTKHLWVEPKLSLDVTIVCRRITSLSLAHAIQTAQYLAASVERERIQIHPIMA